MLLSSSAYFIFFAAVFLAYWLSQRSAAYARTLSLCVLVAANFFFYAKWDLFYLALIPAASFCGFFIGLGIENAKGNDRARKLLVSLSIAMNLGILVAFKYMGFLLENVAKLTGQPPPEWHWSFPLGISFYVFQSLTYTIDLYRGDAKATKSPLAYCAAVSFFPTTLAGPITRVAQLLPQLEKMNRRVDANQSGQAFFLIALGMMKKFLVADYLSENLVNRIFDFPKLYTGFEVLIGVYGYALQLYYDFSGYTDIAIGSALLLALKLPANFNMPYAATSIADFWRRWHISLSNWLRDYLYFSLPGLRGAKIFTYLNLTITMVLGGLWHGASWNFVIWGLLHGVALGVTRAMQVAREADGRKEPRLPAWLRTFVTVQFVCFAWIFFRAGTLELAFDVVTRIASFTFSAANIPGSLWVVLGVAIAGHYLPKNWFERVRDLFGAAPFYAQAAALLLLTIAIQYIAATGAAPFIYTKF